MRLTALTAILLALCAAGAAADDLAATVPTASAAKASPAPARRADEPEVPAALTGATAACLDTAHYRLRVAASCDWAPEALTILEAAHQHFYADLAARGFHLAPLDRPLVWYCFSRREDFEDYAWMADRADVSTLDEYYSTRTNSVAMVRIGVDVPGPAAAERKDDGARSAEPAVVLAAYGGTPSSAAPAARTASRRGSPPDPVRLVHEAAHQLSFNSGLLRRGVMYPLWVCEGLATNFEHGSLDADNPERRAQLVRAHRAGRLFELEAITGRVRLDVEGRRACELYAECWGLFSFLVHEHPDGLRRYLAEMAAAPVGRRSEAKLRETFVAAIGPIEKLQAGWTAWLDALSAPPESTDAEQSPSGGTRSSD